MKKLWMFAIGVFIAGVALPSVMVTAAPSSGCAAPRDNFDNLYCLTKIYVQTDNELGDAYKQLRSALNASGRETLKATELAWIESRNVSCSRSEGSSFLVDMRCTVETTSSRLQFLRERLSECRSVGCINKNLR